MGEGRDFEGAMVSAPGEKGIVYFISADHEDAPVKIGFTTRGLKNRIADLQTGNPSPLRAIFAIDGDQRLEGIIHRMFEHHRLYGEWFEGRDVIMRIVERAWESSLPLPSPPPPTRAPRIVLPIKRRSAMRAPEFPIQYDAPVRTGKRGRPRLNKPNIWESVGKTKSTYYRHRRALKDGKDG